MRNAARPACCWSRSPSARRKSTGRRLASEYWASVQPGNGCTVAMLPGARVTFVPRRAWGISPRTSVLAPGGRPRPRTLRSNGPRHARPSPHEATGSDFDLHVPDIGPASHCHAGGNGIRNSPGLQVLARVENQFRDSCSAIIPLFWISSRISLPFPVLDHVRGAT